MLESYVLPFPKVVRIEPAAACNLACSHCPTGTVDMVRGVMRSETFTRIVDSIKANLDRVKVVVLYHGGEPLLNKRFPEMTREIKSLGIPFVKTVSNGMLITDKMLEGLVSSGLDAIEFSLDGESPEMNDLVRRNCNFHTVVKNIKRLIDLKQERRSKTPSILLSTTQFVTEENYKRKDQEAPVPEFLIREFSGPYRGEITEYKSTWAMKWPHMEILEDVYDIYPDPYDKQYSNYCDLVIDTMTVRSNGDVVSCCYDLTSRFVLGNVLEDDLPTIWNNRKSLGLRRSIDKKKYIPLCANCNRVTPNVFLKLTSEARSRVEGRSPATQDSNHPVPLHAPVSLIRQTTDRAARQG